MDNGYDKVRGEKVELGRHLSIIAAHEFTVSKMLAITN